MNLSITACEARVACRLADCDARVASRRECREVDVASRRATDDLASHAVANQIVDDVASVAMREVDTSGCSVSLRRGATSSTRSTLWRRARLSVRDAEADAAVAGDERERDRDGGRASSNAPGVALLCGGSVAQSGYGVSAI
jgi:hypothetical protein